MYNTKDIRGNQTNAMLQGVVRDEDVIKVQTTHLPNNVATTDISMFPCYLSSDHESGTQSRIWSNTVTSTPATLVNNTMHNRQLLMAMSQHQEQSLHESPLPYLLQQHEHQNPQNYYTLANDNNLQHLNYDNLAYDQSLLDNIGSTNMSTAATAPLCSQQPSLQSHDPFLHQDNESFAWLGTDKSLLSHPNQTFFTASMQAQGLEPGNSGSQFLQHRAMGMEHIYPNSAPLPPPHHQACIPQLDKIDRSQNPSLAVPHPSNIPHTNEQLASLKLHAHFTDVPGGRLFGGIMDGNSSSAPTNVTNAPSSNGPVMEGEVRQQSASSDSQAFYGKDTMVKELKPEFARWFYRYEQDRKWKPFTGYDSIRIESKYRDLFRENITSYSHNSYYPVASSNDESTDFSKFVQQPQGLQPQGLQPQGLQTQRLRADNPSTAPSSLPNPSAPSMLSDMMQHKWWPGKGTEATVDNEFNGMTGYPASARSATSTAGSSAAYFSGAIKGRIGTNKEKLLQKANSASALLINATTPGVNVGKDLTKVIIVREGLYEVDLDSWMCYSTYWPGDTCLITRGTWFYDGTWDPLPLDQAEKLEEAHMGKFCGASLINMCVTGQTEEDKTKGITTPAIHRVSFTDFHVDWTSPTDIHWYSTAASHKFMRSVTQKLGLSDWGHRICRGYYKPASLVDRPTEIGHIIFVIHGIGHKMDTGRIVRNCTAFRELVTALKDKYFPQLNNAKQRAEFFPVEWRSAAKLDNDIVEAITPQKLVTLRQLLNSTAMDIMYYTSPLYRAEIQHALRDELNRIYANFAKRNPTFQRNGGKVSVMAHSLGAVITYDIMTGYLNSVDEDNGLNKPGLLFNLEHFFCLGSPLSVFLALRWREPQDPNLRGKILPKHLCKRIYNVFYSSDPVAYRLEPLLNRDYTKVAPVTIHSYNAPAKPRYSEMPRELIKEVNPTKTASDNTNSTMASGTNSDLPIPSEVLNFSQKTTPNFKGNFPSLNIKTPYSPSKDNNWGGWLKNFWKGSTSPATGDGFIGGMEVGPENPVEFLGNNVDDGNYASRVTENYSVTADEELLNISNDLSHRLDYVLRESQLSGSYIAALSSHTSYWNSSDVAYFVLTHLYDDEQPSDER